MTVYAGLAQGENREELKKQLDQVTSIFNFTAKQVPQGNVPLAEELIRINKWLFNAWRDYNAGRLFDARIKVNTLYQMLGNLGRKIGDLKAGGKKELERAKAGSSFINQVLGTFGLKSEREIYRPDVPGSKVADFLGSVPPWALPAGAGLLLFLLVRR